MVHFSPSNSSLRYAVRVTLMLVALVVARNAGAAQQIELDSAGVPKAAPSVAVDHLAYTTQLRAIDQLKKILAQNKNLNKEAQFLLRLAHLQQENSDIVFRIAHAEAYSKKKPIDLSSYKKVVQSSIATLSRFIDRFPKSSDIDMAWYMRTRAHEELGNRDEAKQGYNYLIANYPKFKRMKDIYLSLAGFAETEKQFDQAIELYRKAGVRPVDFEYPYILHKLAWLSHMTQRTPDAFSYAEQYVAYYNQKISKVRSGPSEAETLRSFRDGMLIDMADFYYDAHKRGVVRYEVNDAIHKFSRYATGDHGTDAYGKMLLRLVKLLRADDAVAELNAFKDMAVRRIANHPASLEILVVVYEDQLNKQRYRDLFETSSEIVNHYKRAKNAYSFAPAEKAFLDSSRRLQDFIAKTQAKSGDSAATVSGLNLLLARIFESYLQIVERDDPTVFGVHYNLAKAFWNMKQNDQAMSHYAWILRKGRREIASGNFKLHGVDLIEVITNMAYLRYEEFRVAGYFPVNLQPLPMKQDAPELMTAEFKEWRSWVELLDKVGSKTQTEQSSDFYLYEANRAIYAKKHVQTALKYMYQFILDHPDSKYAEPSANLVLDTMIAGQDWANAHRTARQFLEMPTFKNKKFAQQIFTVAGDAFYKMTEAEFNAGKHEAVLAKSDTLAMYMPSGPRRADCLNLVSRAAIAMGNVDKAKQTLAVLIQEASDSKYYGDALLMRAALFESHYELSGGVEDYLRFLSLPAARRPASINGAAETAIQTKVLTLSWVSGDRKLFQQTLRNSLICQQSGAPDRRCDVYEALGHLDALSRSEKMGPGVVDVAYSKALDVGRGPNRAVWAVLALEGRKSLALDKKIQMMEILVASWPKVDPLFQFALVPFFTESLPDIFQSLRSEFSQTAKVRVDKESITRRLDLVKRAEKAALIAIQLPWAKVKAGVLNAVAGLYADLAYELTSLPTPRGAGDAEAKEFRSTIDEIAKPFQVTANDLRSKAYGIASSMGVDDGVYQTIAMDYFSENAEAAKVLIPEGEYPPSRNITPELYEEYSATGLGVVPEAGKDLEASIAQKAWKEAVEEHHWPLVGYIAQDIATRKVTDPLGARMLRAVSLGVAGARAEALLEMDALRKEMPDKQKRDMVTLTLLRHYVNTLSKDKVTELVDFIGRREIKSLMSREDLNIISRLVELES